MQAAGLGRRAIEALDGSPPPASRAESLSLSAPDQLSLSLSLSRSLCVSLSLVESLAPQAPTRLVAAVALATPEEPRHPRPRAFPPPRSSLGPSLPARLSLPLLRPLRPCSGPIRPSSAQQPRDTHSEDTPAGDLVPLASPTPRALPFPPLSLPPGTLGSSERHRALKPAPTPPYHLEANPRPTTKPWAAADQRTLSERPTTRRPFASAKRRRRRSLPGASFPLVRRRTRGVLDGAGEHASASSPRLVEDRPRGVRCHGSARRSRGSARLGALLQGAEKAFGRYGRDLASSMTGAVARRRRHIVSGARAPGRKSAGQY